MRILGIDYGDTRTGLALSDPLGWTAQGLETIKEKDIKSLVSKIMDIISSKDVEKIIVGMPKNMNGTVGFRGEKTREFVDVLKARTDAEIILWDERLTTVSAERMLNEANVRGKKRKKAIDTIAATFILQNYLDSIK